MNQPVDMYPAQFKRHARAVEARSTKVALRENDASLSDQGPERLTVDFAHITDATNYLLSLWDFPPALRAFIDALIGLSGYRAAKNEWFKASDKQIAARANRKSTKWVQNQRKELVKWQSQRNVGLIDIEDNKYNQGEKTPHRYRVNIARFAADTILGARDSLNWKHHRFDEAMEEAAKTTRDSLPEVPIHVKHKRTARPDAETSMERQLRFALTKVKGAAQTQVLTGNHIDLSPGMLETIANIRSELDALECASRRSRGTEVT
ncbi:MAG TPA: hypothetical protein VLQ90_12485 [Pyrinomonadaceae bacterium]|nr:hypothetical protein [Pyrinomonadaceae bacterium]